MYCVVVFYQSPGVLGLQNPWGSYETPVDLQTTRGLKTPGSSQNTRGLANYSGIYKITWGSETAKIVYSNITISL